MLQNPDRTAGADPLLARFTVRAERVATIVHHCHGSDPVARLVLSLAGAGPVGVSPMLEERHPKVADILAGVTEVIRPRDAAEAARATVGVGVGEALVAESGSVLVSEFELADRIVSMLSPVLVVVVRAEAVLATLDDVGALLARRHAGGVAGYHAMVTGPSRSADIERSLTVGVQGPGELHVAILHGARGEEGGG